MLPRMGGEILEGQTCQMPSSGETRLMCQVQGRGKKEIRRVPTDPFIQWFQYFREFRIRCQERSSLPPMNSGAIGSYRDWDNYPRSPLLFAESVADRQEFPLTVTLTVTHQRPLFPSPTPLSHSTHRARFSFWRTWRDHGRNQILLPSMASGSRHSLPG
uniref:Uncharacterized protein n=1 Tax=Candidatus Kentrum sp. LFY TaxID=2126342 RepID=A0A450V060_9GAMM|nr:MAG: hypothetical protein BECKLFY1418A_GA0070994_107915 [Candidatus Kentron sp. LFY]